MLEDFLVLLFFKKLKRKSHRSYIYFHFTCKIKMLRFSTDNHIIYNLKSFKSVFITIYETLNFSIHVIQDMRHEIGQNE